MSPSDPRDERGRDVLATLAGSEAAGRELAKYFETQGALGSLALRMGAGEIWSRPGLSRRDRSLVVISQLTALGRELELRQHVAGGLNHGLRREEIDEILLQVAVYAGVPVALAGARVAAQVFAERDGAERREKPPAPMEEKDAARRRSDGLDVLRTLLGMPAGGNLAPLADATQQALGEMGRLVVDVAFGEVWSRPQLSRRDRSLVVVSVLAVLSLARELETHLRGALHHGVAPAELEELMWTTVLYSGFPRAIFGLELARGAIASVAGATPEAPAPGAAADSIRAADLLEIQNLLARYSDAVDRGAFEAVGEMFRHADVYFPGEAEPSVRAGSGDFSRQLARWTRRYPDGTPRTRHLCTNPILDFEDAAHARGQTYFVVFQASDGLPLQPIITGTYLDRFEKVDGAWRFRERRERVGQTGDLSAHLLQAFRGPTGE